MRVIKGRFLTGTVRFDRFLIPMYVGTLYDKKAGGTRPTLQWITQYKRLGNCDENICDRWCGIRW